MKNYKPIESKLFPGFYEIPFFSKYAASKKGEILTKKTKNYTFGSKSGDYMRIEIYKDLNTKTTLEYVHRLVALAFYGVPINNENYVCHLDNNKLNNQYTNLKWCTQSENISSAYGDGLIVKLNEYPFLAW